MNAIILAGGLGTRLRSVVSKVPKCMAPVAARPFLYYLLVYLKRYPEVDRVVLSVGYLREVIYRWVDGVRGQFPFEIVYAVEETPLGTGGGIRLALSHCSSDDVLVLNGDTMYDIDLHRLMDFHESHSQSAITLALCVMRDFDRYGRVECDASGVVTAFREKEYCAEGAINAGVYLVRRPLLQLSHLPERFSFEKEVFEPHVAQRDLYGCLDSSYFIDIGIPSSYRQAQFDFLVRYCADRYDTLLLDRDGTINVLRPHDYVKSWSEFVFMPDFLESAAALGRCFSRAFVVTNQRGVGKGVMSEADLADVHARMCEELLCRGLRIDDIFYSTALAESDPRRKPQRGMWEELLVRYPEVDASRTVMIGDGDCDQAFAHNCGIDFIRV